MGGRDGGTAPGPEERTGRARLLASAGVRNFPAEQGCRHLSPGKSTVEPKAAFPTLGPAPTSSSPGCRDPRAVGVPGHLRLSITRGGRLEPAERLFLQVPTPHRAGPPSSTAHLGTAAARARCPPELPQARAPPGVGFRPPPPFLLQCPPGHPLSASVSTSWGPGRERGSGGARTHAGSREPGRGGGSAAGSRGGRRCRRGGEWGGAGGQAAGEGGVLRGGEPRSDFLRGRRSAKLPP